MKANELRIGNIIEYNNKEIGIVSGVQEFLFNDGKVAINQRVDIFYHVENINSIPLTEEWLLKFGLKKYIGWDDMEFWCLLDDGAKPDRFELYKTLQGFESPSGKIIEHVHTLQNCYFFHELSGEELILKNK